MVSKHINPLPRQVPIYFGRVEFIVKYATGKTVLHLGCVDQGVTQLKLDKGNLLHERVYQVANSLWGVDIDEVGLKWMQSVGYPNLYLADLENLQLIPELIGQKFDLILITEVVEHLDNPGLVLDRLHDLFSDQTEMIITVPNSTSLINLLYLVRGNEFVHPDHNYWFSYTTLKTLLEKHGYEIIHVALYTQFDFQRSLFKHFINMVLKLFNYTFRPGKFPNKVLINTPEQKNTRIPSVRVGIDAVIKTFVYRYLIKQNPFFADGLILVVHLTSLKTARHTKSA